MAWPRSAGKVEVQAQDCGADEDVEKTDACLLVIHIAFPTPKSGLLGPHHVRQQHLQATSNEFGSSFYRRFCPTTAFNAVLGIASNAWMPTEETLYAGGWAHPMTCSATNRIDSKHSAISGWAIRFLSLRDKVFGKHRRPGCGQWKCQNGPLTRSASPLIFYFRPIATSLR